MRGQGRMIFNLFYIQMADLNAIIGRWKGLWSRQLLDGRTIPVAKVQNWSQSERGLCLIALLGKQKHFPVTIFLGLVSHPKMVKLLGH